MAGTPGFLLDGGLSGTGLGLNVQAAGPGMGAGIYGGLNLGGRPHFGVIGLVLLAVALLVLFDRAGFRFAVTAGRG